MPLDKRLDLESCRVPSDLNSIGNKPNKPIEIRLKDFGRINSLPKIESLISQDGCQCKEVLIVDDD